MSGEDQACSYCGAEMMTNIKLSYEALHEATDTVYPSIPRKVVCKDCAERISDYLEQKDKNLEDIGPRTLPEKYVDDILDRIEREGSDDLTIQIPNYGKGYRYHEGRWLIAFLPLPPMGDNPYRLEEHDRSEVKEKLMSSGEMTIKRTDEEAWEDYLEDNKTVSEKLLEDIERVEKETEGELTERILQEESKYLIHMYSEHFGSISAALEEADIEPSSNPDG